MNKSLLQLYGLKWNPFATDIPTEALYVSEAIEAFCWRIENTLVREGGFALITGDPGTGKSVTLRLLDARLSKLPDLHVAPLTHPSATVVDFYRELGDLFGVDLRPHNRWGGFKMLRRTWLAHMDNTLMRPVLLIDEAQECSPVVLSELRLLSSADFDARSLLSVILAGDQRLTELMRRDILLPLGSRMRVRLPLEAASREQLQDTLNHLMRSAGNPNLLPKELVMTLAEHALGNHRVLVNLANELLSTAAQRERDVIDQQLYFEVFQADATPRKRARST